MIAVFDPSKVAQSQPQVTSGGKCSHRGVAGFVGVSLLEGLQLLDTLV